MSVRTHMMSSVAIQADSPMVKAGKMMWKAMVNANWIRASITASKSIACLPGE